MDRKRRALEPPRESKRSSSFTSSSLRSSLNPDLLFCARERERESLRFKEEEDGARANALRLKFLSLIFCLTSTHTFFSNIKTGEEKITQQQQQQHQEANECGGCCSRRR